VHPVHVGILKKALIVLRYGDEEYYRGDILKAVNPLSALGALPSNVAHQVSQIANGEFNFHDSCRLDTCVEYILVGGYVA
jgi:hypothetical protein